MIDINETKHTGKILRTIRICKLVVSPAETLPAQPDSTRDMNKNFTKERRITEIKEARNRIQL